MWLLGRVSYQQVRDWQRGLIRAGAPAWARWIALGRVRGCSARGRAVPTELYNPPAMIRCILCGSSRLDAEKARCTRCGGSPAVRSERCHIDTETAAKLLGHADELKRFRVVVERQQEQAFEKGQIGLVWQDYAILISLSFQAAESLHPGILRDLVRYLRRRLRIPEEQIIRLRLDEPENVAESLHGKRKAAGRKRAAKPAKSKRR